MTNPRILVCTTFANRHWDEHASEMIGRFADLWPKEVGLFVELDDKTLVPSIMPIVNKRSGGIGKLDDDVRFQAFKAKYEKLDDPNDYRKQFFRFSHKIFALNDAAEVAKNEGWDYLVWLDADVFTEREIPMEKLLSWMPGEDEVASYLGRKDWPHSECGFMAFNMKKDNAGFLGEMLGDYYLDGQGLKEEQSDDSWLFDQCRTKGLYRKLPWKNLTPDAPGMNVWLNSPLQAYMNHHKGPVAKANLGNWAKPVAEQALKEANGQQNHRGRTVLEDLRQNPKGMQNLDVKIRNCVPDDEIRKNVSDNLALIPQWIPECKPNGETVVMVSGGPMLDIERVKHYANLGYRIVCVKHALERLLNAGVVPWACVLLDPRMHVENFVASPDPRVNYFVASMCNPKVLQRLLEGGCKVWGYHAAVGADEQQYVAKGTPYVAFGSASAVRGLFVCKALGFSRFILLGYDLCVLTKPDLNEKLPDGNKKYLEVVLEQPTWGGGKATRSFWTEGQFLAQVQELEKIVNDKMVEITAEGQGILPWMLEHKGKSKQWYKKVYSPVNKRRPHADDAIGSAGWRNRILRHLHPSK